MQSFHTLVYALHWKGEEEIDVAFKALTEEWCLQEDDPDYFLEDPIDSDTWSLISRNADITRRSIIDGFGSVKKEFSILSPLKHPHIIQLHGVMMRPLGLILELAPLESLKTILHEYAEAHTHLHISATKQVVIQVHKLVCMLCTPTKAHCDHIIFFKCSLLFIILHAKSSLF